MARASPSDRERFAQLYDEHVWLVYGFFGYRVRSQSDAEDLTQHTFERALRAWDRFDEGRASARTWLMSIARNLLVDHYRSDRSERHEPIDGPDSHRELASTGQDDPRLGPSPELAAALDTLRDRDREILALRFGGDLAGPEIAEITGLSLANVQQILSRSLKQLRTELEASAQVRG
jgi:RNA polymerase sigma factor (sigma-70 family)